MTFGRGGKRKHQTNVASGDLDWCKDCALRVQGGCKEWSKVQGGVSIYLGNGSGELGEPVEILKSRGPRRRKNPGLSD